MTIVFTRWHWTAFVVLWCTQVLSWRFFLSHSPDGPAVIHFFRSLGWWFGGSAVVFLTAGYAFLSTVILARFLDVMIQGRKRRSARG